MRKKLIIAEKPSLAKKIIEAIGDMKKVNDYYENNNYIVTSVFGHLLELYKMEDYNRDYKVWNLDDLPFFPDTFKWKIKNQSGIKERYKLIKDLIKRTDVAEIINSGDADREGEVLINIVVYKIFEELKISKTVKRIWLEDQTENTILKELKNPRDIKDTQNLYEEGLARSYIDWLYGINLTRYISLKAGTLLNTGRVIIPTVKYIYDRDMAIKNFIPETYFVLPGEIEKDNKKIKLDFGDFKWKEINEGKKIENKLQNSKVKVIKIESKEIKKNPKKLFSLSTLQNYMSKKYKINLDKTLSLVQSLYEKGYLTYPRTNTEYMSEEEMLKVKSILKALNNNNLEFKNTKNIFDSSKVESHSAITITEKIANENILTEDERKVYQSVKNRFMANFCKEDCILSETIINFEIQNNDSILKNQAKLKGITILKQGYLKYENDLSEKDLPRFNENEILNCNFKLEQKQTTPPSKVTESELNKFFEKPFKKQDLDIEENIDDTEDYKDILKGVEIGTPATRSATVEKVKKIGYIKSDKNSLSITELGENFINYLDKLNINLYKEKTVELSKNLKKIYNKQMTISEILNKEESEIKNIINQNISVDKMHKNISEGKEIGKCPYCQSSFLALDGKYGTYYKCSKCDFKISGKIANKNITQTIAKQLINNKETEELLNFKSNKGKLFNAKLKLDDNKNIKFYF